jgi:hypothetical protein
MTIYQQIFTKIDEDFLDTLHSYVVKEVSLAIPLMLLEV